MSKSGYVDVEVELIKHETDDAFLLVIDDDEYWIPKSQVRDADNYSKGEEEVTMSLTEWICDNNDLG